MSIYRNPNATANQDKSAPITFVGIDDDNNAKSRQNKQKVDTMMTVGEHCSYSLCGQMDFLPFTCEWCDKKFCTSHINSREHECPDYKNIENENTMPQCPVCNSFVKLKSGESPDEVVDRHIQSGCKTGKLFDPEEKQRIRESLRCYAGTCANHQRAKLSTLHCKFCNLQVCLSHRFPDDHACEAEIQKTKERREAEKKEAYAGTWRGKLQESSQSVLNRIIGKKETQSAEEKMTIEEKRRLQRERALKGRSATTTTGNGNKPTN